MNSVDCIIDEVRLSPWQMPKFTPAFKNAVTYLGSVKDSNRRIRAFRSFINDFGTHYPLITYLGSRQMMTMFLTDKARSSFSQDELSSCTAKKSGINMLGASFQQSSEKCKNSELSKFNEGGEYVKDISITSYGSTPFKDMDAWSGQDFDPQPVKRQLKQINLLLDDYYLKQNEIKINGPELRGWFNKMFENFCTNMGIKCVKELQKGCGYTDNCLLSQKCTDVDKTIGTFTCSNAAAVDGQWSSWGAYGKCTEACGSLGVQTSKRTCTNPRPSWNGKTCQGESERTAPCNRGIFSCPERTYGGTGGGACCKFPFTYQGRTYHRCTGVDSNQLWCYTTADSSKWGICFHGNDQTLEEKEIAMEAKDDLSMIEELEYPLE